MISFRPAWWCRGPHAQTIWGSVLRPLPRVTLKRQRWETPDGDFIDLDRLSAAPGAPILIVLHGLEGSSRSKQVLGLLEAAQQQGWAGIGANFRSCSGQINRLPRSYHGGETADLSWIIQRVRGEDPTAPILCVGVSLGGNVLLKYLGEQGEGLPSEVIAAAAISTPFDLAASARYLEKGFSRFYMGRLVRSLRKKTLEKLNRYPDLVDKQALLSVRTIAEFDDLVTGPVHGFPNAEAYWAASSSGPLLRKIRRPTLLINARDDPFLPASALPVDAVSDSSFLTVEFPAAGGHIGFIAGRWPGKPVPWAEERVIQFFKDQPSQVK